MLHNNEESVFNSNAPEIESHDYNKNWHEHKERAYQLLKQGAKGILGGWFFLMIVTGASTRFEDPSVLVLNLFASLMLAGFPYGWSLINRTIGNWSIFGNILIAFAFFWFKAGFSLIIGITVYPIVLVYNLVQSQKSKQKILCTWVAIGISILLFFMSLGLLVAWDTAMHPEKYSDTYNNTSVVTEATEETKTATEQSFSEDPAVQNTVEELSEVEYVDIFKDVGLQFSGISGKAIAELSLTGSGDILNACEFAIEPNNGLKNGDTVTVTIENTDSLLEEFYTLPEAESKTFTVSGLEYYATAEDLPLDVVQEIASQLVEEKQQENDSDSLFTYSDVELYGVFFMTGKEDTWTDENHLHFIIHYDMLEDNGDIRFSYYIPFYVQDILVAADGSISIGRDDCSSSAFFYDTPESYLENYEYSCNIVQIG